MPSKVQLYAQMADRTAEQITGSYQKWTAFLTTAARLYKYPYNEQLMIFAQRPEATACAEYDLWNKQMRRYVRRGSKGIALVDTSSDQPKLRYVFDVSDTSGGENSRRPYLWEYRQEHREVVSAALEQRFDVSGESGLADQLERVAAQLVDEYWHDNRRDIVGIVDGSFLEDYDEFNIGAAFRNAAVVSTTYALLSRCGMQPGEYFEHEDFLNVFDFNTPQTVAALGTAISQSSELVLRQIEVTIKNYEREKIAERSESHERTDLHPQRGLSDSRSEPDRAAASPAGQVWQDAEGLPEGASSGAVEQPAAVREAVPPSAGDRRGSEQPAGTDDAGADEVGRRDGSAESQRPDEVGRADEHAESAGRGNDPHGVGVQLTMFDAPAGAQMSFFPSEAEQIQSIAEAESVTPSAFSMFISQNDIDHILRAGGNADAARMKIAAEFSKQKPLEDRAAFLKALYHGGNGLITDNGRFSAWYGDDGIHIATGDTSRYLRSAQVIGWADAAERIEELLDGGTFATNLEVTEAPRYERLGIAVDVWNLYHDFSDEAKSLGYLSCLGNIHSTSFPEETERLTDDLLNPAFRDRLLSEYKVFMDAYHENRALLRFHYHRPQALLTRLEDLSLPRKEFRSDMTAVPATGRFITEDEIAASLANGSSFEGGKTRIYAFFQTQHTPKESADFLKKEYGIGGHTHAVSRESGSYEDHGSKGITLKKAGCADVQMNWNKVASRISELVRLNRYLTPDEQAAYDKEMAQDAMRNAVYNDYNDVKAAHPDEIVLYQVGDFFEIYGEDAKQAAPVLDLHLGTRPIPTGGRVDMCGIPAHQLEEATQKLRDRFHVTIAAVGEDGQRNSYSMGKLNPEPPRREITQSDIDEALQKWNGSIDSKHAVVRYMEAHSRERDTAAWLAREYGTGPAQPLRIAVTGVDGETVLPWAKVQRRIAQLIQSDNFYTEQEQDNFDNIDPIAIREALAERGIVGGRIVDAEANRNSPFVRQVMADVERIAAQEAQAAHMDSPDRFSIRLHPNEGGITGIWDSALDRFYEEGGKVLRFAEQSNAIDYLSSIQRSRGMEPDAPVFTTPLGNAYRVGDGFSSTAAEQRDTLMVVERVDEDNVWYTLPSVPEQETVSVDRTVFERYLDTGYFFAAEQTQPVKEVTAGNEQENMIFRAPYAVGDTVYLENTPFEITEVGALNVQLRDPALRYPVFRAESRENFERLLRRDERNAAITDFLPARSRNDDLRDLLMNGILTPDIRDEVRELFRQGEGNAAIGAYLSNVFAASDADTMTLENGTEADFITSRSGFQAQVHGEKGVHALGLLWPDAAPVLRAVFLEETQAQSRIQAQPEPDISLPEQPASEATEPEQPQFTTETVAFYPGEKSQLPYDIEIQTIRTTEPEPPVPQKPPAENFRITDDNLGIGGAKAKFRANMAAINLLKELEFEGAQATPEEQDVLSKYVGWGGLADAFDESKDNWKDEFAELYATLSPEEYAAARASTLNAHYTSPTVIKAIYEAVGSMGFQTGNILEPAMGVGNFFGLLPQEMQGSRLYGVELDSITGRIAKQLYPKADITVAGFETTDRRDFFDLAIGNVPFGQYQVSDWAYNKLGFSIHDYFFAKTLDQVRPGGVIAFVTSRYTMDKQSPEVRKYIAQRAELLGAIRLPNNAFKANAGTEVVSDIIFLQKRDRPIDIEPDWVHLGENEDGFSINQYFIDNPEMVLGRQTSESTQYGRQDFTVEPYEDLDLATQLRYAIQNIGGKYEAAELPDLGENDAIQDTIPADPNVKNYSYAVVDGEVYYRENSVMVKPNLNATARERVKGMAELRDCVHRLIDLQMWESDDVSIRAEQQKLNRLYDRFTEKYGLINSRGNALAFADDSSYYLLCSLEMLDDEDKTKLKGKADMFTKRTIRQRQSVTSVDTAAEALALSIGEKARVDMAYMSQLTGKSEEDIIDELNGVIFLDPVYGDWQTADEYLSGNVRQKLREAENAAVDSPGYLPNVEALRAAQPKDLDASEIEVRLGATWIDKKYIQQFMFELLEPPLYARRSLEVNYSEFTAEWNISGKNSIPYNDINARMTYGTDCANAYKILEDTLNLRDVRIYDTVRDADGTEKRVLNSKETTLAQQKQQAIKEAFRDWIWKDPDRRRELVQLYNERFNSTRPREYDGRHLIFPGMNPEITLREHQLNAIAHDLYGGNTLLAHEVGAGKTFEMIAAAMEGKRLGLCQKSLFAVPNHLTEQWASEFLRLYPSANILVATKKDFETRNRKKFCARIATGDYDAVIIGHSQFERIPVSRERQERLLQEQIWEIEDGIAELKASRAERFTIKELERTKKNLKAKLQKLHDAARKDDVVTFEQLGVDRLYVDEAHSFKNLFLYTKMRNVAGLSTTDAQKSSDMLLKCRYIDEITHGKGVTFATGTPISNSMTELYTMMRYLQHDMLKRNSLTHFDCWASAFGETTTAIELAPEGTGYRARTRFAKFFNLPELMNLFREAADIKTSDQLNLPTPTPVYHNEVSQPTPLQKQMVQELSERAAKVHAGIVDASTDNMLKITSDGRKLGLDQRVINPDLPDDPNSKVNRCVDNIHRIWQDGQTEKLTQLVFCDLSTPKGKAAQSGRIAAKGTDSPELHALEAAIDAETGPEDPPFTIYDDIREKLVARGIPREQIAFIHEANTEVRKKELFAKVRSGQVRVLMGSTFKMGAGMNVQDRLVALHDLDCPWRPGDLEQRSGRIIRQGNRNKEVHIYRYVTESTFDAYLWQTVENKQKFISQIMTSKSPVRSCEDIDEAALSYAEIKALCAGDERIREKMDLDVDVARLRLMKANHQSQQYRLEDNILRHFPAQIEENKGFLSGFEADMKTLEQHPHPKDGFAGMEVKGDFLTDKDNAGAAILEAFKDAKGLEPVPIGSYRGFAMSLTVENFGKDFILTLKGRMSHRVELGKDARGNLVRIDNALAQMPERYKTVQGRFENVQAQLATAKAELGKPFPQEEELRTKSARLAELNAELNIDDRTPMEQAAENVVAKRPSVLDKLKVPSVHGAGDRKKSHEQEAR